MIYRSVGALVDSQETISLNPQAAVQEAAVLMADHRVGAIPVLDSDGELVGLFTELALLNGVVSKGLNPEALSLADVMTNDPITVTAEASLVNGLTRCPWCPRRVVRHPRVPGLRWPAPGSSHIDLSSWFVSKAGLLREAGTLLRVEGQQLPGGLPQAAIKAIGAGQAVRIFQAEPSRRCLGLSRRTR